MAEVAQGTGGVICNADIVNGTGSGDNVVIIAAGVTFIYYDGGTYQDYDASTHIVSGQSQRFRTNDDTKCVVRAEAVVRLQVPGQSDPINVVGTKSAPPGICAITFEFTVGAHQNAALVGGDDDSFGGYFLE